MRLFKPKHYYIICTVASDGVSLDVYALGEKRMTESEALDYIHEHTMDWDFLFIVARSKRYIDKFAKNKLDVESLAGVVAKKLGEGVSVVDLSSQGLGEKNKKVVN